MRETGARAGLAVLALLLAAAAAPAAFAADSNTITATIELRENALTASLYGASSPVRVALSGTVHVDTQIGQWVEMHLSIEGVAWARQVTPTNFTVKTASADVPFSAWVDVPTSAAEGAYGLAVRGVDPDDPNHLFPIDTQAQFTVSVFDGPLAILAPPSPGPILPGGSQAWTLTLHNFGSFAIDYDEAFSLGPGLSYTVQNPDVQVVDPGAEQQVVVTVRAAATATAGDSAWSLTLTSQGHPEVTATITVPVEVAAIPLPPAPAGEPEFLVKYWVPISVGLFGVGLIAYFSLTEVGYLAVAFSLFVPLFTRIRHEKVLDNFTRGQIFGYIQANPGAHYSAIQQVLDIENGVLAYHLRVLMREEFVVARNEGVYKRFYPRDYKIPKGRTLLTRLQVDILEAVEKAPGVSQRDVAQALGESKQVISYNVGVLRDAGLISAERRGRDVTLHPAEGGARGAQEPAGPEAPSDLTTL